MSNNTPEVNGELDIISVFFRLMHKAKAEGNVTGLKGLKILYAEAQKPDTRLATKIILEWFDTLLTAEEQDWLMDTDDGRKEAQRRVNLVHQLVAPLRKEKQQ